MALSKGILHLGSRFIILWLDIGFIQKKASVNYKTPITLA